MHVLGTLSVLFACSVCLAQTPAPAISTAAVSGRVTIGGKGAPGITVVVVYSSPFENKTVAKTTTDDDGKYRLTGLAAGRITITPIAKAFVIAAKDAYKETGQTVNAAENDSITNIDFALVRGGVITGRVTDLEGHPIIGENVNVLSNVDSATSSISISFLPTRKNQTDDRGVYRIYGLGPGSYRVSVGQASAGVGVNDVGMGASQYTKTFYPGVTDEAKATLIEINEGAEVSNIDITPGKPASGFTASGRVVDAESGKPVAGAFVGYAALNEQNQRTGGWNFSGLQTDANGKFRMEGVQSGHYLAFTRDGQENSSYSDSTPFDVSDGDVTGIEIKVRPGATIQGVAVIENNVDPSVAALLQALTLYAYVADTKNAGAPSFSQGKINPDGSFRLTGLGPGKVGIMVLPGFPTPPKGLQLVRTELEGLEQTEGIEVTAGAHITGVRLVFSYGTGKIRGEVRVEGGELPEGTTFFVSLRAVAGDPKKQGESSIEVDARGHFLAEGIAPGTYELTARPRTAIPVEAATRTITVANGTETQVILVVNLAGKKVGP